MPTEVVAEPDNITKQLQHRRDMLNTIVARKTGELFLKKYGHHYKQRDPDDMKRYGPVSAQFQAEVYRVNGIPKGTGVGDINNTATLDRLIEAFKNA